MQRSTLGQKETKNEYELIINKGVVKITMLLLI